MLSSFSFIILSCIIKMLIKNKIIPNNYENNSILNLSFNIGICLLVISLINLLLSTTQLIQNIEFIVIILLNFIYNKYKLKLYKNSLNILKELSKK